MNLHFPLKEKIESRYAGRLSGAILLKQDALLMTLDNGVVLELRYPNREEYSIAWQWGDAGFCIDTAPLHHELKTFPNHLHDVDGSVREDPLTVPGREPWENIDAVLGTLLVDPLVCAS